MNRRVFLFLQGPHGPFFHELAQELKAAGHDSLRIGLNQGDAYYWPKRSSYIPYRETFEPAQWRAFLERQIRERSVTDIVLYGDSRPIHEIAKDVARQCGTRIHCFEEGYLRPYWITYERDGANGNSRLNQLSLDEIEAALTEPDAPQPEAPAQWGAVWHHIFFGSLYHANVLFRNGAYPNYEGHRSVPLFDEWMLHIKRLLQYPGSLARRRYLTARLMRRGRPFHVALLQLGHDAAVQDHSEIGSMAEFIAAVVEGFARGAPQHHQLVFKAHPLEDGREPIAKLVRRAGAEHGIADRIWYIPGGKLGPLLDRARSAVTVNSTAGQQVLWRGLPLKTFGRAVYGRPEFVSDQPLEAFFADPVAPQGGRYRVFRQFLLETSQITGGFYTARGRRLANRELVDLMLMDRDIYEAPRRKKVTPAARLQVVGG